MGKFAGGKIPRGFAAQDQGCRVVAEVSREVRRRRKGILRRGVDACNGVYPQGGGVAQGFFTGGGKNCKCLDFGVFRKSAGDDLLI